MELPKQFDNITQHVIDDLKTTLSKGSKVSMAAASFSIYAFEALQKELEKVDELRFIFTSPTFNKEREKKQKREFYIPKLNRDRTLYGSDFEIKLRNNLTQKAIAKECADWIRRKVRFKTNVSQKAMQGFLEVKNDEGLYTYMPFNEFTTTELGCERGNDIYQIVMRMPSPMSDAYLKNFNDFWEDRENFADVTETIIENIESVYRENAPDFIYFVTLYNIFHEFLEDISEDVLPNEATGFKSSQIWNKLYNFQRDAALAIINKLATYNGCILADSVGLFDRQSLDSPTIHRLGELYALGATRKQEVIFWQIDIQGRVRSGKIMKYGPDGHRVKDEGGVNWVHSRMMKQGLLPQDWELTQCLFGEHLLNWPEHRDKVVALVESEKSALIGAACFPNYVWLATGGKSQFSPEKMKVLKGRTVILFPDVDGYQEWKERSKTLTFCKVVVSDVLEKNVTAEEREARIDIADWLVKQLKNGYVPPEPTEEYQRLFGPPPKTNLEQLIEDYPFVQKLVDALDLREEA